MVPWWVEGAEVHSILDQLDIYFTLSHIRIQQVDNDNGFCLREQIWADGMNLGVNREVARMLWKVGKLLT